jgi:hypothetical protein
MAASPSVAHAATPPPRASSEALHPDAKRTTSAHPASIAASYRDQHARLRPAPAREPATGTAAMPVRGQGVGHAPFRSLSWRRIQALHSRWTAAQVGAPAATSKSATPTFARLPWRLQPGTIVSRSSRPRLEMAAVAIRLGGQNGSPGKRRPIGGKFRSPRGVMRRDSPRQAKPDRCDPRRRRGPWERGHDQSGGYAIHGTNAPNSIGHYASRCIRIANIMDPYQRAVSAPSSVLR